MLQKGKASLKMKKQSELFQLVDKLEREQKLSKKEWIRLIEGRTPELAEYLFEKAVKIRKKYYGNNIFIRGLIEISSVCKNDCYYCGIRRSNKNAERYHLTRGEILECCREGYELGFRSFVLQGGEDPYFSDTIIVQIVSAIKSMYPDCAVTLSLGEKSRESYQAYFNAGADRYLLRHETADFAHYRKLHPSDLSLKNRMRCLKDLKEIGYQTGSGFMVGSPGQTPACLAEDMLYLKWLNPQMVGIGPFVPHHDTPFAAEQAGTAELTVFMLGLIRLMLPSVLLPATTALGTIDPYGREKGILAGANVVMPNLSPQEVRTKYALYDNKLSSGSEAAEHKRQLQEQMQAIGYTLVTDRGDYVAPDNQEPAGGHRRCAVVV